MKSSRRSAGGALARGTWPLFFVLVSVILGIYLWGKVQIDFVLRETQELQQQRQELLHTVNDLNARIIRLTSYQRIVPLARERGLVFVPAPMLAELEVESAPAPPAEGGRERIQYAGFSLH